MPLMKSDFSRADCEAAIAKAEIHFATHFASPYIRAATVQGTQVIVYTGKWVPVAKYDITVTPIRVSVKLRELVEQPQKTQKTF